MMIGAASAPVLDEKNNIANFSLKVTEHVKDASGKFIEEVNDFECLAVDKIAVSVMNQVKEGMRIAISGRMRNQVICVIDELEMRETYILVEDIFLIS